jgi:hypothetical protein
LSKPFWPGPLTPLSTTGATIESKRVSTFSKPVTPIEKFYIAVDRLHRPFVNQLVVQGRGRVAHETLRAALRRTADANPGVTLHARGVLGRMRWVQGTEPRFSVHASAWDGRSGEGAPFLQAPLDPHRGPSCELQLVEGPETSSLIFRSLHATMDGNGTTHWATEVFRALREEPLLGSDCTETDAEFAAGLNDEPFEVPPSEAIQPFGEWDPDAGDGRRWVRVSIEAARTDNVLATIATTLARQARRQTPGEQGLVRINIPADLRLFHPEKLSTGNLIGTVFEEVGPEDSVEAVSERVKQRLRNREHARFPRSYRLLRWIPIRRIRILVQEATKRARREGRYRFSATVSYLGDVAPEAFTTPDFSPDTAFFIPPVAQQSCFVTGTRMHGTLELLVAAPEALWSKGRGEELVAALREALTG